MFENYLEYYTYMSLSRFMIVIILKIYEFIYFL